MARHGLARQGKLFKTSKMIRLNCNYSLKTYYYDGKIDEKSDIDGHKADNVRQVFWFNEGATLPAGQSLQIKGRESHIALGEYNELPISTKHRERTPEGNGPGMEGYRKGSNELCGHKPDGNTDNT